MDGRADVDIAAALTGSEKATVRILFFPCLPVRRKTSGVPRHGFSQGTARSCALASFLDAGPFDVFSERVPEKRRGRVSYSPETRCDNEAGIRLRPFELRRDGYWLKSSGTR